MKTDHVTKTLLGLIVLLLALIALNGYGPVGSSAVAQRAPVVVDQKFSHVQLTGDQNGFYVFDSATGRIWYYAATNFRGNPEEVGQLEEPGKRLGR